MTSQTKILILAACCLVAACSTSPEIVEQVEQPVDVLYRDALKTAVGGDPKAAAPKFEEVERQHPYSELATRAQIMAAWSFYEGNQYSRAISALDRFVELNPADPLVEYAYYLKALSYYEQIVDVERDAEMTRLSLAAFEELARRFPRGTFARDGQLKIDLTKSHLAGKEMAVGRFYLEREQYTAAIRRFDIVIQIYYTTNQVPEALYRTAEAYYALGLSDQSERLYQVAKYNYPESVWTERLSSLWADPEQSPKKGLFKRSIDVITNKFF
ncbi:outer membrane protein assembly factor BamD [Alphaproteobacteria bacterium]|nr:outer membrane protein assembly factor BamD [Alphaproteobacteria bacterium]